MLRIQSAIAKVVNFKNLAILCFIIFTNLQLKVQLAYKNLTEKTFFFYFLTEPATKTDKNMILLKSTEQ